MTQFVHFAVLINSYGESSHNPNSILIMDSYYATKLSLELIDKMNVKFIASIKSNNFQDWVSLIEPKVTSSGMSAGLYDNVNRFMLVHK